MSVAIVAPQAKISAPASAKSADSVNPTDTPTSGSDFASLLLGQLVAGVKLQPAMPESTPSPPDGELAPQDAALMLATLGIVPRPIATDVQPPAKTENTLLTGITGKESGVSLKDMPDNLLSSEQETVPKSNSNDFILPVATGVEDKPAKVAVENPALLKTEALPTGDLANNGQAIGATSILPNTSLTGLRTQSVLKVETPLHDHTWAGDFSQKVVWLASNDKQVAQLTLNPPQMGPIEISLNLDKDGASAFFVSQNAEVRDAIETALPRLREMLAGVGIELGQANVGAESFRQQAGSEEARQGAPRWMADNAILGSDSAHALSGQAVIAQRGNGLVDTFA